MNCQVAQIPLLEKEGWLRHQLKLRSHRSAADGVVSSAKCSGLNNFAELTTPAAPSRNGSILLMARPPLLFKEGNIAQFQFIHRFYDRAQFIQGKARGHWPRLPIHPVVFRIWKPVRLDLLFVIQMNVFRFPKLIQSFFTKLP
jgi:hypothetical protein